MKNLALVDLHKPLRIFLEGGGKGNMGEIGGSIRNLEICRKEPVMKMMDEHHFAGNS